MTQEEAWRTKYKEIVGFIKKNGRNPSRYDTEERGKYVNWLRHNRKLMNAGKMKPERVEMFQRLLALANENKHMNQYK